MSAAYSTGSSCTRSEEVLRIKPTNIETIGNNISFPCSAQTSLFLATSTSRHAAHSNAEPRAMSKNRHRSGAVYLPFPSAMFKAIDVEALSN